MVKPPPFQSKGMGVIPGWGTKILHATQCSWKKKKKTVQASSVGKAVGGRPGTLRSVLSPWVTLCDASSVGVPKQHAGIQPAHTTPAHLCCVSDQLCKKGAPAPSKLPLSPQPVHLLCVGHLGAKTSGPRVAASWGFRRTS